MQRKNIFPRGVRYWPLALCIGIYLLLLAHYKPAVYTYHFQTSLIDRYLHSQDIPIEDLKGRVFLSDSEIHIAVGYLYAHGKTPTQHNFQHPPLLKYLYGLSIGLTGNPLWVQILFGVGLIALTYLFGLQYFSRWVGALAAWLLVCDPILLDLSAQALLDLGQSMFMVLFLYLFLRKAPAGWLGVVLGACAASKFWSPVLFLLLFSIGVEYYQTRHWQVKRWLVIVAVAAVVFGLAYLPDFIARNGAFNIIFFQLKILKYWLHQSVTAIPFATPLLFLTGYFKSWWGNHSWMRADVWSPLWPLATFVAIVNLKGKLRDNKIFIYLFPLVYLLFLSAQAPFPRYFIVVLPFLYLCLADVAVKLLHVSKVSYTDAPR